MTQETKPKDCCYGVRPLSDCQCEKDRLAALAATPAVGGEIMRDKLAELQNAGVKSLTINQVVGLIGFAETEAALAATPAVGGEPLAWLYEMAFKIKPSDEQPFTKWKQVVTIDLPPTIPKDGVRNVVPLYAAPPASPLRGRDIRESDIISGAMAIARSRGHDPDEPAPLTEMCTDDNAPVPWWMVFMEESEACLKSFATLSASPPEQPAAAGKLACRRCGGWGVIRMGGGERETCNLCHGTTIDPDQSPAATPDKDQDSSALMPPRTET